MKKKNVYVVCSVLLCSYLLSYNWFSQPNDKVNNLEYNKEIESKVEIVKNENTNINTSTDTKPKEDITSRSEVSRKTEKVEIPHENSLGVYTLTAYCGCSKCCGKNNGITASGKKAKANHTIAAPRNFAFGTRIKINGKIYVVEDRGGAIQGKHIDIYFNTHQEALNFGRQKREIFLIK